MGALTNALVTTVLASTHCPEMADPADRVAQWQAIIAAASVRFSVPCVWIERVIRAESGGRTTRDGRPIRSSAGAIGLMQVMPATWAALRIAYRLGIDPDDPHDNIVAGTAYLRMMLDRFGYPGAFAAYNAGPARYTAFLVGHQRLPAETIAYLSYVTGGRSSHVIRPATPPTRLLFALRRDLAEPLRPKIPTVSEGLFAIRKGLP